MSGGDLTAWLRAAAVCLWLAQPACAATPQAAEGEPEIAIGIAAFEAVGGVSAADLDVGARLAERIGSRGVRTVVGPDPLGSVAAGEPTPAQVQAWAANAGVATIAVGRTTRIGERQNIDVRLRAGNSGGLVGSYFAEAATADALDPALDRLAEQIVEGTVDWMTGDVAAAGVAPPTAAARGAGLRSKGDPFGLTSFDSDQPIAIRSEELEATQNAGARRLVFSRNVRVEQGDLTLTAARLEAFYPPDAGQPDRLVADGGVHVVQGTREARCDEAVYQRAQNLLVCEGNAELVDGDDRVSGSVIEFDLATERVFVKGGASVVFHPEADAKEVSEPAAGTTAPAPAPAPGSAPAPEPAPAEAAVNAEPLGAVP